MPERNSAYRDGIVPIRSFHRLRKYKIRIHQTFFHPFCHLFVIIISIKGGGRARKESCGIERMQNTWGYSVEYASTDRFDG